jgi:hypothetical protein
MDGVKTSLRTPWRRISGMEVYRYSLLPSALPPQKGRHYWIYWGFLYVGKLFFHTEKWIKMGRWLFVEVLSLTAVKNSRQDSYKIRSIYDIRRQVCWALGGMTMIRKDFTNWSLVRTRYVLKGWRKGTWLYVGFFDGGDGNVVLYKNRAFFIRMNGEGDHDTSMGFSQPASQQVRHNVKL